MSAIDNTADIPYDELFNLDYTMARYIYPRMVAFKAACTGYPCDMTEEEYGETLNKIILAFKYIVDDEDLLGVENEDKHFAVEEGLKLFGLYFRTFWL